MNFPEDIFKQYPFIYLVDEKYYVMGVGVCVDADDRREGLKPMYAQYIENFHSELDKFEALRIFSNIVFKANIIQRSNDVTGREKETFEKMNFDDEEKEQLCKQAEMYVDFWKRNRLNKEFKM